MPVCDLVARMGYKDQGYRDLFSAPYHIGKTAEEDVNEYRRRSPAWNAEKLQTPLLIHTTTNDEDVNVLEVEHLIKALKAAGKKFEHKIYKDAPGGHAVQPHRHEAGQGIAGGGVSLPGEVPESAQPGEVGTCPFTTGLSRTSSDCCLVCLGRIDSWWADRGPPRDPLMFRVPTGSSCRRPHRLLDSFGCPKSLPCSTPRLPGTDSRRGTAPARLRRARKLAASRLAAEKPGQTLQATALVHEAYVRLVGPANQAGWDGHGHFFSAAAEAMRRILIDRARHKGTRKAGGGSCPHRYRRRRTYH